MKDFFFVSFPDCFLQLQWQILYLFWTSEYKCVHSCLNNIYVLKSMSYYYSRCGNNKSYDTVLAYLAPKLHVYLAKIELLHIKSHISIYTYKLAIEND